MVQKQNNRLRHLKSAHLCEKVGAEEEKQKKEKTNYLYITGLYYRWYAHKSTIADHYNYCKKSRKSYIQTTMGVQFFYCANFAQTRQKSVCKGNKVNRRRRVRALTLASGVTLPWKRRLYRSFPLPSGFPMRANGGGNSEWGERKSIRSYASAHCHPQNFKLHFRQQVGTTLTSFSNSVQLNIISPCLLPPTPCLIDKWVASYNNRRSLFM